MDLLDYVRRVTEARHKADREVCFELPDKQSNLAWDDYQLRGDLISGAVAYIAAGGDEEEARKIIDLAERERRRLRRCHQAIKAHPLYR